VTPSFKIKYVEYDRFISGFFKVLLNFYEICWGLRMGIDHHILISQRGSILAEEPRNNNTESLR